MDEWKPPNQLSVSCQESCTDFAEMFLTEVKRCQVCRSKAALMDVLYIYIYIYIYMTFDTSNAHYSSAGHLHIDTRMHILLSQGIWNTSSRIKIRTCSNQARSPAIGASIWKNCAILARPSAFDQFTPAAGNACNPCNVKVSSVSSADCTNQCAPGATVHHRSALTNLRLRRSGHDGIQSIDDRRHKPGNRSQVQLAFGNAVNHIPAMFAPYYNLVEWHRCCIRQTSCLC